MNINFLQLVNKDITYQYKDRSYYVVSADRDVYEDTTTINLMERQKGRRNTNLKAIKVDVPVDNFKFIDWDRLLEEVLQEEHQRMSKAEGES